MSYKFDKMPLGNLLEARLQQGKIQESRITNNPDSKYAIYLEDDTFTVPAGVTDIYITACGGGGAGSGGNHRDNQGAGGGGAAAIVREKFTVNPGDSIILSIGKGGTSSGEDGTATVIGNLATLLPGKGTRNNVGGEAGGPGGGAGGNAGVLSGIATGYYGQRGILGLGGLPGLSFKNSGDTTTSPKGAGGGGGSLGCGGDGGVSYLGAPIAVDAVGNRGLIGGRPGQGTLANPAYSDTVFAGGGGNFGAGGGGATSGISSLKTGLGGPGGQGLVMIEWF